MIRPPPISGQGTHVKQEDISSLPQLFKTESNYCVPPVNTEMYKGFLLFGAGEQTKTAFNQLTHWV